MAAKTSNIIIFGATGLIGEFITNAILESKADFGRIVVFTSPKKKTIIDNQKAISTKVDKIERLKSQGTEIISGDVTSADDVNAAFQGIDTVVSCVGRPVIQNQLLLLKLADEHPDVKRFFPSEYGTDIEYGPMSINEKPHQQKIKVRAAMKHVKNLDSTYVVTGPYGNAESHLYLSALGPEKEHVGSFDVKRKRATLIEDGQGKISLTTMQDVGKLVVAAIKNPEAARNKALRVNSFTATPKEIVAEFEKQTGEKWDVQYTPLELLKTLEKQGWERGDPTAGTLTLRRIWAEGGTLYDERDNHLIGMEDGVDSLQTAVKRAIAVQTGLSTH